MGEAVIPKKIHCWWIGGQPMPALAKRCVESWKQNCLDYEVIIWGDDDINLPDNVLSKTYARRQYAFLVDYLRFDTLFKHGGVFFDIDMELIRRIPCELLCEKFWVAEELKGRVNGAAIGSAPGNELCALLRDDVYSVLASNRLEILPNIMSRRIGEIEQLGLMLPPEVFYPYNPYDTERPVQQLMYSDLTDNSVGIHHWQRAWTLPLRDRMRRRLSRLFSR